MSIRKSLLALTVLASFAGARDAQAGVITNLFSTGVSPTGAVLGFGATDTHYTVTGPASTPSGQAMVIPFNPGYPTPTGSQFITSPTTNFGSQAIGNYTYTTTFSDTDSLGTISGRISADDSVTVLLNGTQVASVAAPAYLSFANFTINSGFTTGLNTLTFVVNNIGGPQALDVTLTAAVPEPASLGMVALGLGALLVARRTRRTV